MLQLLCHSEEFTFKSQETEKATGSFHAVLWKTDFGQEWK